MDNSTITSVHSGTHETESASAATNTPGTTCNGGSATVPGKFTERFQSFNKLIEDSIKANWDRPALSNFHGVTLFYRDLAERCAKLHILFEKAGIEKGDKIAICSRNQANWAVSFIASITYGAVCVPILHEFKAGNIHYLINHSEAVLLFADETVWDELNVEEMPELKAVMLLSNFSVAYSSSDKFTKAREHINELFGKKYPMDFSRDCIDYHRDEADELALINYTSGTSGFSKGVMIPYRALWSNYAFAHEYAMPVLDNTSNIVSMLPLAHTYGMMFEFLFEMCIGAHVHFINRVPSPKVILSALQEIRPDVVIAVPLVIEKIFKSRIKPVLDKNEVLFKLPIIDKIAGKKVLDSLKNAFGGKFKEVIVGGAAFNPDVEKFFKKIEFPYTVGYGMTECAPIICYEHWNENKLYSCGKAAPRMELRIESPDPCNIPGEVQIRGANVFLGYYKNEEATAEVFTEDGWFRTGDMGVVDNDGFLFLKGRSKCMILGPSGQNIYPEEIEAVINNLRYVSDSLVIEDHGLLKALIYPDYQQTENDGMDKNKLQKVFDGFIPEINANVPGYAKIAGIEIMPEDFERTPKRSIKRYLYYRDNK